MELPAPLARIVPGELAANPPLLSLLVANIVTIVLAVIGNWDLASVLFIYWAQSIIIGIFAVVAILSADTSLIGADMGRAQAEAGGSPVVGRRFIVFYQLLLSGFFCVHYGLFHWGYYNFIVDSGIFGPVNFGDASIWISCSLFFVNHLYSFLYHRGGEVRGTTFVTKAFFEPYSRIVPMHVTILFGSIIVLALGFFNLPGTLVVLVLFLILKTRMDIVQHLNKHHERLHPDEPLRLIAF